MATGKKTGAAGDKSAKAAKPDAGAEKSRGGRPSHYDEAIANVILERVAAGESLRKICKSNTVMPNESTFRAWVTKNTGGLAAKWATAVDMRADAIFDEMFEIADTPQEAKRTKIKANGDVEEILCDATEHRKLQINTRMWILARMSPKKYGNNLDINHSGQIGDMSKEDMAARMSQIFAEAQKRKEAKAAVTADSEGGDE